MKYFKTFNTKTTLKIGEITPVFTTFLQPNTHLKINQKSLSRLITPLNPTMDAPLIDFYTFAIRPGALFGEESWQMMLKDYLQKNLQANVEVFKTSNSTSVAASYLTFEIKQPRNFLSNSTRAHGDAWEWREKLKQSTTLLKAFGLSFDDVFIASDDDITTNGSDFAFSIKVNQLLPLFYERIYYYFFRDTIFDTFTLSGVSSQNFVPGVSNFLKIKTALALPNKWNTCRPTTLSNSESLQNPTKLNAYRMSERYYLELLEKDPDNYGDLLTYFNANFNDPLAPRLIHHKRVYQTIKAVESTAENSSSQSFVGDYGANSTVFENWDTSFKNDDFTLLMTVSVARYAENYYNVPNPLLISDTLEPLVYIKEKNNAPYKALYRSDFRLPIETTYSRNNVFGFQEPYYDLRHGFNCIANDLQSSEYENWHYAINANVADSKLTPNMRLSKRDAVSRTLSFNKFDILLEFQTDVVEQNNVAYYNTALDTEPAE